MVALTAIDNTPQQTRVQRLLLAALLVFVFLCGFFQVSDVDVGFHLRTGAYVVENRAIPSVNTFSFSEPDHPWLLHQWWPATVYYLVYSAGGVGALITFKALLGVLVMYLAWLCARQESARDSLWPFWLVTLGVLIARVRFFERPLLFSTVLFVLLLWLDRRHANDRRWQWVGAPLLMAFWANTHAGVVYGFVYLATVMGAEWLEFGWMRMQQRRLGVQPGRGGEQEGGSALSVRPIGLLLSVVAAGAALEMVHPHGFRVMLTPLDMFSNRLWQSQIQELFPPTWKQEKLFYLFLASLIILQVITRRSFHPRYFFVTLAFGFLACQSQRSIEMFTLAAIPHAAWMLRRWPTGWLTLPFRWQQGLLPATWLALSLLVILPDRTFRFGIGFYAPYYPLEILQFLKDEVPAQHLFNDMRYGGEIMWWLHPKFKPFVDGRGEACSMEFWWNEYLPVINGDAKWHDVFRKYDVHGALLSIPMSRKVSRLAESLRGEPGWALVAFNDHTLLFLERTTANREVIARNEFKWLWPGDWSLSTVTVTNLPAVTAEARRALVRSPECTFAQTALARASLVGGDHATAAEWYAVLTRAGGVSASHWRDYGYALFMLKRFDEADRVFTRMLREGMERGFACYMKHFLALQSGKVAEADHWLNQAQEWEPRNEEYQQARARLKTELAK